MKLTRKFIHDFADINWVGDLKHIWLIGGYVFILFNGELSCINKMKYFNALLSNNVEYMESTNARNYVVWL